MKPNQPQEQPRHSPLRSTNSPQEPDPKTGLTRQGLPISGVLLPLADPENPAFSMSQRRLTSPQDGPTPQGHMASAFKFAVRGQNSEMPDANRKHFCGISGLGAAKQSSISSHRIHILNQYL